MSQPDYPNPPANRRVESIFGIDVDWTSNFGHGYSVPFGNAHNLPLNNIQGAFGQDSPLAATFALHFPTWLAATGLAVYFCGRERLWKKASGNDFPLFGLRTGLVLFAVSRFFAWVYEVVPNTMPLSRGYLYFGTIPVLFQYAADTTLVWTFCRTVCQPLVVASSYPRAKSVGLGLTITYGFVAAANWAFIVLDTWSFVESDWAAILYYGYGGVWQIAGILDLILWPLAMAWGLTFFAFSVHALRPSKCTLDPGFHTVPKHTIAASGFWLVRCLLFLMLSLGFFDGNVSSANYTVPLCDAVFVDILGLIIFGLFCGCYRTHYGPFFEMKVDPNQGDQAQSRLESLKDGKWDIEMQPQEVQDKK